jgi:stress-induced morphogen
MSSETKPRWEQMRTGESRKVEEVLGEQFQQVDAYRYNSASIRVRVVDPKFEGKSIEDRESLVEPLLNRLPENIQADIINLLTLAPSEIRDQLNRHSLVNLEFDDPSPSML